MTLSTKRVSYPKPANQKAAFVLTQNFAKFFVYDLKSKLRCHNFLVSEIISIKLLNNKIFQMSNSEFNLPSITFQADEQRVTDVIQIEEAVKSGGGKFALANFRLKRSTKSSRVNIMVNQENGMATRNAPILSNDKNPSQQDFRIY